MRCPKCNQADLESTSGECPNCGFHGNSSTLASLSHIRWLLEEMAKWPNLGFSMDVINRLRNHYTEREKNIEIELGLRPRPLTAEELRRAKLQLLCHEALYERLAIWHTSGLVKPDSTLPTYAKRTAELREQLTGYTRDQLPKLRTERLEAVNFIIEALSALREADAFTSPEAEQKIIAALQAEKETLEISLGLRPAPQAPVKPIAPAAPLPVAAPTTPKPPPKPIGERLRRSILSERTLQALIFMGIFLLLTAAISFVISGWKDFSAPLRVGIPTLFTLTFLGLGWLVRTKTKLYRSGIALTAIAALLVPIDAYTVYVNYIPAQNWSQFWLIASIFSLLAYTLLTLQIQSRFFGYLVGIAAGSLILAVMEVIGLPRDAYGVGLSILAVVMLLSAGRIDRGPALERLRVFVEPFRYLGLWLPAVLMPLTMGQWLVLHHAALDALQNATAVTWFLGGFIFGWGAVRYRSVGLGRLAALALPVAVFMGQLALFDRFGIHRAWHAFGLALLTPLYFAVNYRLSMQSVRRLDPMLVEHAASANACGWMMVVIAAILSLFDLTSDAPAAAAHAVLAGSIAMSAILWRRPRQLYLASFFALTASSFLMTELRFKPNQLGIGWASLAILYILLALGLARFEKAKVFLSTLVTIGYGFAALAILPALISFSSDLVTYTLGNFIALSAWGAALAYRQRPGFYTPPLADGAKQPVFYNLRKDGAIYHWFAALLLPYWLWTVVTARHDPDFSLALALAALAWGMVAASHWLRFTNSDACRRPWRTVGLLVSVVTPFIAFNVANGGYTPSITVLSAGLLYFADALASHHSGELYPAALVSALGLGLLLDHAHVDGDVLTFVLCLLSGIYILGGLWAERRKLSFGTPSFLTPLYHSTHIVAFIALARIGFHPHLGWTDQMQLWGAVDQLLLAVFYACHAWGRYNKAWAFISVWLAAAGGGFLILLYSSGQGSLAAKAALIVTALVLLERSLHTYKASRKIASRWRAYMQLFWRLYRQPLLFTGWAGSVAVIVLALVRNYLLLGGGRLQQTWAAIALLILTALYALSARLFRQPRFVSFAVYLAFIPWTILTNLGWFTSWQPSLTEFPLGWMALAWVYFLVSLIVRRYTPKDYVTPLTLATWILTPFSLLWAVRDVATSRYTVGMAVALYGLAAWLDHRRSQRDETVSPLAATKFLYPALALVPLWGVYWLKFLAPWARHEHFGLLLLGFAGLYLLIGKLFERLAPHPNLARAYGLPAYITSYATLVIGILLTVPIPSLLTFTLLYATLLMIVSVWLFRSAIWVYPAAGLLTLSLLTALGESAIPLERRGWWLIGLAAVYLAVGWLLRRFKLNAYATAAINVAYVLIALGLPPSSQDRIGAFWGYSAAALLYGISAFWLGQPLLLAPACALIVVPYASALQQSTLEPRYYGLALLPGALLAIGSAVALDARLGTWRDFPWRTPSQWLSAFAQRLLGWWAFSFYIMGFGLASAAPFFAAGNEALTSLSFSLLAIFYIWAIFRFRGRFWLWAATLSLHLAYFFFLRSRGFEAPYHADFWLNFMPVTVLTTGLALWLQRRFNEGAPMEAGRLLTGWSRPLYFFVLIDIVLGQLGSFQSTPPGMWVSLAHALLIGILASAWGEMMLIYAVTMLGLIALLQLNNFQHETANILTIRMAWLGLGYGLFGFGYRLLLRWPGKGENETSQPQWAAVWEHPLQHSALLLSTLSLILVPILGIDLVGWSIRALFGMSFRDMVQPETVRSAVWVFSLVGLLYTAAAAVYRRVRLGYFSIGLLMAAWFLYAFYINIWANLAEVQWYAIPAGLYMLAVSYVEWTLGNKRLARWLDYAAMLLLMGSLFWQTLRLGLLFCLMMIVESLGIFGWGMVRRLRRFFYTGIVGVMLAILRQFLNGLQQSVYQSLIWGLMGLLVVIVGILVERKLEAIKAWEQRVLETWE